MAVGNFSYAFALKIHNELIQHIIITAACTGQILDQGLDNRHYVYTYFKHHKFHEHYSPLRYVPKTLSNTV